MGKKVLAFDLNLCTGCRACEVHCSFKHYRECNPAKSRIRVVKFERVGVSAPLFCLQCEEAFCREACPTQAIQRDNQTGALVLHPDRCVGCRACTMACPFSALHVLPDGKVDKCDLCGGDPYCVKYCETGAIRYVDAEEVGEQKAYSVAEKYAQAFLKSR
jgi:carbon-monoxide dehydrogenase iron sulfur subunit